jgi:hypothetical protein
MMVVLLLIVSAAVLLGHGFLTESTVEVGAAGVLALLGVIGVFVDRRLRREVPPAEGATAVVDDEADEVSAVTTDAEDATGDAAPGTDVVFVPGQLVFHDPGCQLLGDRPTSHARRCDLEAGGMAICDRCLADRAQVETN